MIFTQRAKKATWPFVHRLLLIMKLAVFLTVTCIFQAVAESTAQEITLNVKQVTLRDVMKEIQRQQGYLFFFRGDQIATKRVSAELNQANLSDAMDLILNGQGLAWSLNGKTIIIRRDASITRVAEKPVSTTVQQRTVTGTVTDEQGNVLDGVTVAVKGTTTVVTTDGSGNYRLPLGMGAATLVFSNVGFETHEQPVTNQNTVNITLKVVVSDLDEVVVVGYSSKSLSELSSAVAVVNSEKLQGVTSQNLGSMLQGKVPGLMISNSSGKPGQATNVVVRGVGSIGAGYQPLYVVDGIIGGSADPLDIESVTVLKDAAATGLYGSRAANGVIIITTKSGKSGKAKVTYSGTVGFAQHQDNNLQMMDGVELYDLQAQSFRNFYDMQVAANDPNFTGISFGDYLQSVLPSSLMDVNTDWQDLLSRGGGLNRHQLALSGGSDKTRFYVSGNYYNETGTLINTSFRSAGFRANLEHDISDRFKLFVRANGSSEKLPNEVLNGQEGLAAQYFINMPWDSPYEEDGITPYNPMKPGSGWIGNAKSNYFYDRDHYSDLTRNLNLNGDVKLTAKITDWMSFSTSNRWGFSANDWTQLLDQYHVLAVAEKGRITQEYAYDNSFITSNLLNLNHRFGKHSLAGILGQEYNYIRGRFTQAVGIDVPLGLSAVGSAGSPKTVGGNPVETGFSSYFGQVDYNYNRKYYLVGSLRTDGSSRFGTNNKWGTFYSLGASWLLSEEAFFKNAPWLDALKLRASYGTTGNANIANYLSLGTFVFSSASGYNGNSGARPARIANPDLTWEIAQTTNIGLELAVMNRFRLELDVYNKNSKDLLQDVPLPATTGFSGQQRNVGAVQNRGVDATVSSVNMDGAFGWETTFNINLNRNKVIRLNNGEDIASGNMRIREGLPLRYFYMKEWAGVDATTGKPLWIRWEDENGNLLHGADHRTATTITTTSVYNQASNLFIQSAYPDVTGGLRNDFRYGDFALSVLCTYASGQHIFFGQRMRIDSDGAHPSHNQMRPAKDWVRWEKPGDSHATHPQLINGGNNQSNNVSSRYIEDASYFRVQNIGLTYRVPLRTTWLSRLSLQASVDNVAVFTKFSGGDPDVNMESPVINQDANSARYSPTRKVLFGLNAEF